MVEVCKIADLPAGKMKSVTVGENRILVANVEGKLHAMRAICNHEGGPLDEGELDHNQIICPWHGAIWDVTTGKTIWFPMKLDNEPLYAVKVENGTVYVETEPLKELSV